MINLTRRHALGMASLGTITSLLAGTSTAAAGDDAFSLLQSDQRFSYWVQTLKFAGLQNYVTRTEKFTAFIPTNTAMSKYPRVLAELTRVNDCVVTPDTTNQAEFIRAHIVPGLHPLSAFAGKTSLLTSIAKTSITIDGTIPGIYRITWVSIDWRTATTEIPDAPITASNALLYPFSNVVLS